MSSIYLLENVVFHAVHPGTASSAQPTMHKNVGATGRVEHGTERKANDQNKSFFYHANMVL